MESDSLKSARYGHAFEKSRVNEKFSNFTFVIHQCHHDVWKGVSTVLPYFEMTSVDAIGQRECCVAKFQQEQLAAKEAEIAELKEIQFLADTILPPTGCL